MITTEAQFEQAREALTRVETALAALRERVQQANPALFAAMAEDYAANIRTLRAGIDEYLGVAATSASDTPLWMVLEGDEIPHRDISSRLLSEWLGNFRKAVYGVASFLESGRLRLSGGRPEAALLEATDPYVVAVAPGSIRVGLRLPDQEQSGLFDESTPSTPQRALNQLMTVASWAASEATGIPSEANMTSDEIRVAARFATQLAPSPRSTVRTVTFSGTAVPFPKPLRLQTESRERLQGLVKMLSHVTEETVRGHVREIDLDARRLTLRERGPGLSDMKCHVPDHLMSKAQKLLDEQAWVTGLVSSSAPDTMNVRDLGPAPAA